MILRNICRAICGVVLSVSVVQARDVGTLWQPVARGKFSATSLWSYFKLTDNFDVRGDVDVTGQVVGAQFAYGATDQISVALLGGSVLNPRHDAQNTQWEGRAGVLYGLQVYGQVLAPTGFYPGVQLSAGVNGFQIPLDRQMTGGPTTTLIENNVSGTDMHGALLAGWAVWRAKPYAGIRVFGREVFWQDNQAGVRIRGTASGNASFIVGVPVRITESLLFQVEGVVMNGKTVTAGFTWHGF